MAIVTQCIYVILLIPATFGLLPSLSSDSCNSPSMQIDNGIDYVQQLLTLQPILNDLLSTITINLYTPDRKRNAYKVTVDSASEAPFYPSVPTEMIIHGYLGSDFMQYVIELKDAYLKQANCNVLTLDYSKYAILLPYDLLVKEVPTIAEYAATVLIAVKNSGHITFEMLHITAASLGSHIAGFIGKFITSKTGEVIERIIALDAAGPSYETGNTLVSPSERLATGDAELIVAIHTGGDQLGIKSLFANADYIVNGGIGNQPGCKILNTVEVALCNHVYAVKLYEALFYHKFPCTPCQSLEAYNNGECAGNIQVLLGFPEIYYTLGSYFLNTTDKCP